jgi:aerobic carbon-monoxide dehydrogenase medium subunit
MYASSFDYQQPSSVKDAVALLSQLGDRAKILAGGHSLIPLLKLRLAAPEVVIDIGRIRELAGVTVSGGTIRLGSLTTHHAIEASDDVRTHAPLLAETASAIGDPQVRNRGTIGGSVAHADPTADWPAALLALDATFVAEGPTGSRRIPASAFFTGPLETALAQAEILTAIEVPVQRPTGHGYAKVRQPASGFALVGIAVQLVIEGGTCRRAAIGLTGLADTPSRATAAERLLTDRALDRAVIDAAASHIADGLHLLEDLHASSEFRGQLARVHAARALGRAAGAVA